MNLLLEKRTEMPHELTYSADRDKMKFIGNPFFGKFKKNGSSFRTRGFYGNPALVFFHDTISHAEAEAGAFPDLFCCEKGIKNL
jgi:hypothetical protein